MNIHVHIERLVLEGELDPAAVLAIRRDLRRELARLMRDGGLSSDLCAAATTSLMRGGSISRSTDRIPAPPFGSRLARAVYEAVGARR